MPNVMQPHEANPSCSSRLPIERFQATAPYGVKLYDFVAQVQLREPTDRTFEVSHVRPAQWARLNLNQPAFSRSLDDPCSGAYS